MARFYSHQVEQHQARRARGCFRVACLLLALVFALLLFVILRRSGPADPLNQTIQTLSAPQSWSRLHYELLQQLRDLELPDGAAEVIAEDGWTAAAATPPTGFAAAAAAALPSQLQAALDFASNAAALSLPTNHTPPVTREQKRRATKASLTADRYLAALQPLRHRLLCKLPLLRQAADYAAGWKQRTAQQGGAQSEHHAAAADAAAETAHQALLAAYAVLVADRRAPEAAARARHPSGAAESRGIGGCRGCRLWLALGGGRQHHRGGAAPAGTAVVAAGGSRPAALQRGVGPAAPAL